MLAILQSALRHLSKGVEYVIACLCLLITGKSRPPSSSQAVVHPLTKSALSPSLLDLPEEILVMVMEQMHDPASTTALGLTCKKMYKLYSGFFRVLAPVFPSNIIWANPHLQFTPPNSARSFVRLNIYTRSLPHYAPLHELIRDFFPKDLVYWNGGYRGWPKFVTKERLAELIEADKPYWNLTPSNQSI